MIDPAGAAAPQLWHGAGNRFALHDGRGGAAPPDAAAVCAAHGADGLIVLAPPAGTGSAAAVRFHNPDGAAVGACGNGLRCAALALDPAGARGSMTLDTPAGPRAAEVLRASATAGGGLSGRVRVSLGAPTFAPPPADPRAFADLLPGGGRTGESGRPGLAFHGPPIRVDVGNPHAVLLLEGPPTDGLVNALGPAFQVHPLFADAGGVNVGFAFVRRPDRIELRVWERGVGETAACGTGAGAAVAAAIAVRRCVRRVSVAMPGGDLEVDWPAGGALRLTGPAVRLGG